MLEKKITFDRFIRLVISFALFCAVIYAVNYLSAVLLPFFIAWIVAYVTYPIVTFFQYKLKLRNRALSIIAMLLLLAASAAAFFYFVIPPMVDETAHLKAALADYLSAQGGGETMTASIQKFLAERIDTDEFHALTQGDNIMKYAQALLPRLWTMLAQSLNILFGIFTFFIIIMYLFFILLDYEHLEKMWVNVLPKKYRHFAEQLMCDVENGMKRYFRGQGLVALLVGILFSIGFLIIDFPMAIGLGLFIGALNLVPYLQIVGFIPTVVLAALKAYETNENFWWILCAALLVFAVVQLIQDMLLVPKIMGHITGLNPAIILLSLSVWGALMGIIGMIIALPMTTLVISYYKRFVIGNEKIADA